MTRDPLNWRRALVYGLGLSGRAATRLLSRRGIEVVAVDDRVADELDLGELTGLAGVDTRLGGGLDALPSGVDGVVVSPGVPPARPLLAAATASGLPILAEVELAFRYLDGPVLAITGSNGKSTTTELTGALLEASGHRVEVCGNIGRPLADCVEGPPGRTFVTELSSFQLEAIDRFHPRAAALLNLSADHLDRHLTFEVYAESKRRIFRRQTAGDVAVLNADDPLVAATVVEARRRFFSSTRPVEDGCFVDGDRVVESIPGQPSVELFERSDLELQGPHNLENAMAAALLARAVGAPIEGVRRGMASFAGLPHRLQLVRERAEVRWFDDSKGTNPAATVRSLEGFRDGSVHLILGGRSKGSDPAQLADAVRRKVRRLYLIGEAATEFDAALGDLVPSVRCGELARAVAMAVEAAAAGESVVLSPACASFDQFVDYRDRGLTFQRLVRALD